MVHVRCPKCGGERNFFAETMEGKRIDIPGGVHTHQIKQTVHMTCLSCHHDWRFVPVNLRNPYEFNPFQNTMN